jgi:hypothetical protein
MVFSVAEPAYYNGGAGSATGIIDTFIYADGIIRELRQR